MIAVNDQPGVVLLGHSETSRGEFDGLTQRGVGQGLDELFPVLNGVAPHGRDRACGLGLAVGPTERGTVLGHGGKNAGGDALPVLVGQGAGLDDGRFPVRCRGKDTCRVVATLRGAVPPVTGLLRQGAHVVGVFGAAGGQGGLLPQLEQFRSCRAVPVRGFPLGDEPVGFLLDRTGAGGELLHELVRDADKFDAGSAVGKRQLAIGGFLTADLGLGAEGAGQLVEEQPVESLRGGDDVLVQGVGVQGDPLVIGLPLHPVGDHHVCAAEGHRPGSPSGRTRWRSGRGPARPRLRRDLPWCARRCSPAR